ncbi:MAG: hypothetical protein U9N44_04550 [Chloroflexota bacterium]|nr:hypothetical protein [Chloroflexota bacterium]
MGSRDFRHKETKKPKKDTAKKAPPTISPVTTSSTNVKVIKRGKKEKPEE